LKINIEKKRQEKTHHESYNHKSSKD